MKNRNVVEIYDFTFGTAILFNILANTVLQRTHIFSSSSSALYTRLCCSTLSVIFVASGFFRKNL